MDIKSPTFTVFTPTYNRGYLLYRLYESLLSQTNGDFEWIIIDDGSTDNTEEICKAILGEKKLIVKYFKKKNGGKHTAWLFGLRKFSGKYVICADSDDLKTQDMIEVYDRHWKELEQSEDYDRFWEIKTRCVNQEGKLVGSSMDFQFLDSNNNDFYYKLGYKGELSACRKKSVLMVEGRFLENFKFSDKCSNFSEGIIWSRVSRKYKTRYVNKVTRIYYTNNEGSLSNATDVKGLYNGLTASLYSLAERRDIFLKYNKRKYLKFLFQVSKLSLVLNENTNQYRGLLCFFDWSVVSILHKAMRLTKLIKN